MNIGKKDNPNNLTDAEIEFLRTSAVPPEVKAYLSRQHENIGTKITAYRKVAAAAQAECEAIEAVLNLDRAHGRLATLAEAKERLAHSDERALRAEHSAALKDRQIMRLTAESAMAVSGD